MHVAIWPGSDHNTKHITRFLAMEGRSFVISASALLRDQDIPQDVPYRDQWVKKGEVLSNGGSCIAGATAFCFWLLFEATSGLHEFSSSVTLCMLWLMFHSCFCFENSNLFCSENSTCFIKICTGFISNTLIWKFVVFFEFALVVDLLNNLIICLIQFLISLAVIPFTIPHSLLVFAMTVLPRFFPKRAMR